MKQSHVVMDCRDPKMLQVIKTHFNVDRRETPWCNIHKFCINQISLCHVWKQIHFLPCHLLF